MNEALQNGSVAEGRTIEITRLFDAPRDLVWKVWTEEEHIRNWWGPKIFSAPEVSNDFRVGGKYHYVMRSNEGQDFWTTGIYQEIEKPSRIVYTDSFADADGNVVPASYYNMPGEWPLEMLVTVTFEEEGEKTKMTLRHTGLPDAGNNAEMAEAGWGESMDKFEAELARAAA